jgi:nitroreductase
MHDALSLLQQRHSAPSRQLGEPAPDDATLRAVEAAIRVPDHGKLVPFRLIALRGDAKLHSAPSLPNKPFAAIPNWPIPSARKNAIATPTRRWSSW